MSEARGQARLRTHTDEVSDVLQKRFAQMLAEYRSGLIAKRDPQALAELAERMQATRLAIGWVSGDV